MGRGRESSRDESAVQADINRSLRESGGQWTSGLNDLVAERDRARSGGTTSARSSGATSGGLASLSAGLGRAAETVRSIPGNIARDVRMGTAAGMFGGRERQAENLANRGFSPTEIQDYFARTDATIARNAAEEAARRNDGPSDAEMAAVRMGAEDIPPEEQMPRFRSPFGQTPTAPGGKGGGAAAPQISPAMRQEALRIFESQRGAGQIPYQMLPFQQGLGSMRPPNMPQMPRFQPMPQPRMPQQNVSPAFQYAAQNYNRLGGSQRLMDRPMEMMSVAERQRINQMAQGMAGMQRPTMPSGKGGANPALLSAMFGSGIGSFRGSGR